MVITMTTMTIDKSGCIRAIASWFRAGWAFPLLLVLLTGCGSHGQTRKDISSRDAEFPDPTKAYVKGGTYVDLDQLRLAGPGLSKRQLYALLGMPHFSEGMWGVHEWNYLFNLDTGHARETARCQLLIKFDKQEISQQYFWKPASCAALLNPLPPPPPAPAPASPTTVRLSTDALFDFDSDVLKPEGQQRIDQLAQQIRRARQADDITVMGHADRLGPDAYNLDLSRRRALAVREALIQRDVPAELIRATGLGSSTPLVKCADDGDRQALIDCLAPNRRVEISGLAIVGP